MNLKQLLIVREIIRANFNVTEAAAALFTSQSGLSQHIKELETELGVEIFERKGKRLTGLTEPGLEIIQHIDRLLLSAENIRSLATRFSATSAGTLTIATTHTQARYALAPVISKFRALYPDVNLVIHQSDPKEVGPMLLDGKADIGLATDTLKGNTQLAEFPCYTWRHTVIAPKKHPIVQGESLTLDILASHPIITYDKGLTGRLQIDAAFEKAKLKPRVIIAAVDSDVVKTYVSLGLGVGIIASMAFDKSADTNIVNLGGSHLFPSSTTSIAVRKGRVLRDYTYRFIELCAPSVTEDIVRNSQFNEVPGEAT